MSNKHYCRGITLNATRCHRKIPISKLFCYQYLKQNQISQTNSNSTTLTNNDDDILKIVADVKSNIDMTSKQLSLIKRQIITCKSKLQLLTMVIQNINILMYEHNCIYTHIDALNFYQKELSETYKILQNLEEEKQSLETLRKQWSKMMHKINWQQIFSISSKEFCCSICMEDEKNNNGLKLLCHHVFHRTCILEHFARKLEKTFCSNCRRQYNILNTTSREQI